MIPLPLLTWTVWIVTLWTSGGSGAVSEQATVHTLYPKIHDAATIECFCQQSSCEAVFWFRTLTKNATFQYLGTINKAERADHGPAVNKMKFRFSKKGSVSYVLRVNATEEDAGVYGCVLKGHNIKEMLQSCAILRPGVTPPTLPPPTKPSIPLKPCNCKKKAPQEGCGSLVLWPLVGIIAGLALAIVCSLQYFSRLPKKCRHRLVKKR